MLVPLRAWWPLAAGALGGVAWVTKAGAILATGSQPPFAFEVGVPLFAIGLVGLYFSHSSDARAGRLARWGLVLALVSLAATISAGVGWLLFPGLAPEGEEFAPLSIPIVLAATSLLSALALLGLSVRRARLLPGVWRNLPLAMAIALPPLILAFAAVAAIIEAAVGGRDTGDRVFEIPILLFGASWVVLGYRLARPSSTGPEEQFRSTAHATR
jgi:hypothetical protein